MRSINLQNLSLFASGSLLTLAILAACHAPTTALTRQPESAPSPVTVLHVLTESDGMAVRGALTELDGRLFGLAGERGPNGSPSCSSSALWQTTEHTLHCPGSLFSLRLDGSDFRVEHAFSRLDGSGRNSDGYHPFGTLAVGPDRRLYGVTQMGGAPSDPSIPGFGVLFAYEPARDGQPSSFEVLHHFFSEPRAMDGEYPMGIVAIDAAGNVFGTAKDGGTTSTGTVWEWSPGGAFRYAPLPGVSYGGVTLSGGLLHGTTWSGGAGGVGVYFTVDPQTLVVRVVDSFPAFGWPLRANDNTPIQAPLALRDGTVIAVREFGRPFGTGLVARLSPDGITALWSPGDLGSVDVAPRFSNATGGMPNGQVVEGRDGMIYGTAQYGGAYGTGAVYRIARDGTLQQLLWSWPDAAYSYGGLVAGSDGAYYGVTWNTSQIYRFTPSAACGGGP